MTAISRPELEAERPTSHINKAESQQPKTSAQAQQTGRPAPDPLPLTRPSSVKAEVTVRRTGRKTDPFQQEEVESEKRLTEGERPTALTIRSLRRVFLDLGLPSLPVRRLLGSRELGGG